MAQGSGRRTNTKRLIIAIGLAGGIAVVTTRAIELVVAQDAPDLVARARAIHERVITLDTHNDIDPAHFTPACNYTMRLTNQVDLPKMKAGGLDVSFMIVYVGQSNPQQVPDAFQPSGYDRAYKAAIQKFDAVHRLTREIAPNEIELALSPADVVRIAKSGKKVAVIGIENGYPIGTEIGRVKEFWQRGGRYMSLAHNGHNQLADSHTGEASNQWSHGGLSPLGRQVIAEMNRVGIMIDVSHPSKGAIMQAIALSKAPVIASHSSARRLANTSRNLDDETLVAIKTNGGVVQTVALSGFVKTDPPERTTALSGLRQQFGTPAATAGGRGGGGRGAGAGTPAACPVDTGVSRPAAAGGNNPNLVAGINVGSLSPDRRRELDARLAEIDRRWPAAGRASVKDFADHVDYIVKLIGLDHVGISSDFDGGGGVDGWNDASETFNVTLELVRRGYTEEQLGKIWSGNLLRVWGEVERVATGK